MTAGARTEIPTPATTKLPGSVSTSLAPRRQRGATTTFWTLSYRTGPGKRVQSEVYRQKPAAERHRDRLLAQGYPVTVRVGSVGSWSTSIHTPHPQVFRPEHVTSTPLDEPEASR